MVKKISILLLSALLLSVLFISCHHDHGDRNFEEVVAVANRGSGSVSFVDATTNDVLSTLAIPNSQPMYVVYVKLQDKLYVGDRAGNKVHVIDPETRTVESSIDVGNGVFHMWADGLGRRLWVNNDVDKTTSVIDLHTNTVIETIDLGIKPHDVFVNKIGTRAYISVLSGDAQVADSIYMYSAITFQKLASRAVGKDPHVFHLIRGNDLFVPCQSGTIYKLNGSNLNVESTLDLPGTHGIFASPNQRKLFVANIGGAQLYTIKASNNTQIGNAVATSDVIPHNIAVNRRGDKIFVTHSGMTANKLSTYSVTRSGAITADADLVTLETNPFGLAYYKRRVD